MGQLNEYEGLAQGFQNEIERLREHQRQALHDPDVCNGRMAGNPPRYQPECVSLRAELEAMRKDAERYLWRPIETAPKDGTEILVYCPRLGVCGPAKWDVNKFAKTPRPFWSHWGERIWGVTWVRSDQPTHWMPLPGPPHD